MKFETAVQNNASVDFSSGTTSVIQQPVVSARPVTSAQLHARHGTQGNSASRPTTARPSRYTGTRHSSATPPSAPRPPQHGKPTQSSQSSQHGQSPQLSCTLVTVRRETLQAGPPQHVRHGTQVHATAQPHLLQHHVHHSTANQHSPASRLSTASHLSSAARSSRYALCRVHHSTTQVHATAQPHLLQHHVHHST